MNYSSLVRRSITKPDLEVKLQGVRASRVLSRVAKEASPKKEQLFVALALEERMRPGVFKSEDIAA